MDRLSFRRLVRSHFGKASAAIAKISRFAPFLLAFVASVLCIVFDLFERLFGLLEPYEAFQADELFISAVFFSLAALYYQVRRNQLLNAAISESRALERRSYELARIDDLTGLPNRRAFLEALGAAQQGSNLLLIDLDRFKVINDWSGHQLGDKVLIEIGNRLRKLRDEGLVTIAARIGGDEFACLADGDASLAAERLIATIGTPMYRLPDTPRVQSSIGIVALGRDVRMFCDPLRDADRAMYAAKRDGGAMFRRYEALREAAWA